MVTLEVIFHSVNISHYLQSTNIKLYHVVKREAISKPIKQSFLKVYVWIVRTCIFVASCIKKNAVIYFFGGDHISELAEMGDEFVSFQVVAN